MAVAVSAPRRARPLGRRVAYALLKSQPIMTPASSNPAPGSRLRRWGAYLSLLVACMGTVATSKPYSPPVTAEHIGETVRLTAEAPKATRNLVIRISAKDGGHLLDGEVLSEVAPRWQPTDPNRQQRPSLSVKLKVGDEDPGMSNEYVLAPSENPGPLAGPYANIPHDCDLEKPCEWNAVLEFELRDALGEDVVEVDWRTAVSAYVRNTSEVPKGFTVHISEP